MSQFPRPRRSLRKNVLLSTYGLFMGFHHFAPSEDRRMEPHANRRDKGDPHGKTGAILQNPPKFPNRNTENPSEMQPSFWPRFPHPKASAGHPQTTRRPPHGTADQPQANRMDKGPPHGKSTQIPQNSQQFPTRKNKILPDLIAIFGPISFRTSPKTARRPPAGNRRPTAGIKGPRRPESEEISQNSRKFPMRKK